MRFQVAIVQKGWSMNVSDEFFTILQILIDALPKEYSPTFSFFFFIFKGLIILPTVKFRLLDINTKCHSSFLVSDYFY
jgi:hypothetical protein